MSTVKYCNQKEKKDKKKRFIGLDTGFCPSIVFAQY